MEVDQKRLILFRPDTPFGVLCKQSKPCSSMQNAASDQGQHCLLTEICNVKCSKNENIPQKTPDNRNGFHPKDKDGHVYCSKMD